MLAVLGRLRPRRRPGGGLGRGDVGTACWLAAVSAAGLLAAAVMVRAVRGRRPPPRPR